MTNCHLLTESSSESTPALSSSRGTFFSASPSFTPRLSSRVAPEVTEELVAERGRETRQSIVVREGGETLFCMADSRHGEAREGVTVESRSTSFGSRPEACDARISLTKPVVSDVGVCCASTADVNRRNARYSDSCWLAFKEKEERMADTGGGG